MYNYIYIHIYTHIYTYDTSSKTPQYHSLHSMYLSRQHHVPVSRKPSLTTPNAHIKVDQAGRSKSYRSIRMNNDEYCIIYIYRVYVMYRSTLNIS